MSLQQRCDELKHRLDAVTQVDIGDFCRDFTVIGGVVNLASRLQGAAHPGEILVTEDVYQRVGDRFPRAQRRLCQLKGLEAPVPAYAVRSAA